MVLLIISVVVVFGLAAKEVYLAAKEVYLAAKEVYDNETKSMGGRFKKDDESDRD